MHSGTDFNYIKKWKIKIWIWMWSAFGCSPLPQRAKLFN